MDGGRGSVSARNPSLRCDLRAPRPGGSADTPALAEWAATREPARMEEGTRVCERTGGVRTGAGGHRRWRCSEVAPKRRPVSARKRHGFKQRWSKEAAGKKEQRSRKIRGGYAGRTEERRSAMCRGRRWMQEGLTKGEQEDVQLVEMDVEPQSKSADDMSRSSASSGHVVAASGERSGAEKGRCVRRRSRSLMIGNVSDSKRTQKEGGRTARRRDP